MLVGMVLMAVYHEEKEEENPNLISSKLLKLINC